MYKALYRKYRPITFNDVFGQEAIVKTLQNSIINSSYSHAYMFFGPRGTGKTSVSKIFARAINCLEPIDGNACGKCKNCLHSFEKECVDIIEIDAASNNGVDEIRELKNKISLVPAELKYKVYIIDEVHMLSIGAFNALLKTLEEPPEHVIFILATTDPQKVPETIISRCQCFSFKRISTDQIVINLKQICEKEKILIDDDVINEIAYSSAGGMRDSLSSLDQLHSYSNSKITLEDYAKVNGSITNEEINKFFIYIFSQDYANVLSSIKKYNDAGKNIITILEKLMRFMRNKIINFYINSENSEFEIKFIHKLVLLINEKLIDIKKSSNPIVYIEMILLDFMNELKSDLKVDNINSQNTHTSDSFLNTNANFENQSSQTVDIKGNLNARDDTKKISQRKDDDNLEKANKDVTSNIDLTDKNFINAQDKVISNINEIIEIRVNNTLAKANKQMLINEISKLDLFNDYTFDSQIGYIVCSILDAKIRAVSEDNIIISYEYDSIVKQNLSILDKIIDVYNQITNSNKKIAIISDKKWEDVRNKYINDLKNGVKLEVADEPIEIFEEEKNNDIINNEAIELFGDIVEIE